MSNYAVGDYIMHVNAGVCKVTAIEEKALEGKGSEKMYYELAPVFQKNSTVWAQVADPFHRLRTVKTKEEFEELFDEIPELEVFEEPNERARQEKLKAEIALFDPRPLASVVKTAYLRKRSRIQAGKKSMSADERVLQTAGNKLFEEMAFAMKDDAATVRARFYERLDALEA